MSSQVSVMRCADYEKELVFESVHQALALLGGIGQFVKKGQTVLLKPNMLSAKKPERGITTHPLILEAMVNQVRSAGGEPWIGDSPSGALKGIQRYWENTGFLDVAQRTGTRLINFEAEGATDRTIHGRKYHIAKAVLEADVVINLPKFKTHGFTLYTGAIKNLYGVLPGLQKAGFHKKYPHPGNFSQIPVDLLEIVKPSLTLMDAILGMEGDGPATGKKRMTRLILASADAVSLDAVASHIMGFKEDEIDAIVQAAQRGLGKHRLAEIDVAGEALEDVRFDDFLLPSNRLIKLVPEFLMKWVGKLIWVRPYAQPDVCTGCRVCAKSCPVKAIEMVDNYPVIDYDACINCLCCNESCPDGAIIQKLSWLARRIG